MIMEGTSMVTQTELSVNTETLLNISAESDDLDVILQYYNISKDGLKDIINNVKEWYERQPHLPQGHLHDRVIIGHLISRAFRVERVKEKIENCLVAKNRMPKMICNKDPLSPQLDKYLRQGYWVLLPKKTPDNYRVSVLRIHSDNDASLTDVMKTAFMLMEYRFWNDVYLGDIWILDLSNVKLSLVLQATPVMIWKLMFYATGCYGVKIRGIHLVNLPSYALTVFSLFKKAMKTKLVQRIHMHNKIRDAFDTFPKEMVPKDFGGDEMSLQEITDEWLKTFQSEQWRKYFIEQDNIRIDESKRIAKSSAEGFFGIDGSFKKLNID